MQKRKHTKNSSALIIFTLQPLSHLVSIAAFICVNREAAAYAKIKNLGKKLWPFFGEINRRQMIADSQFPFSWENEVHLSVVSFIPQTQQQILLILTYVEIKCKMEIRLENFGAYKIN